MNEEHIAALRRRFREEAWRDESDFLMAVERKLLEKEHLPDLTEDECTLIATYLPLLQEYFQ